MINMHPTEKQLTEFVKGELNPAMALVVSAHADMCPQCQLKIEAIEQQISEAALADTAELPQEYASLIADITSLPCADKATPAPADDFIELDGRRFPLPRALQRYADSTGNWSLMPGKLWQAPVDMGINGKANFIYMEKGGRVPEHTHKGSEITLVINGEFSDGLADYDSGDFMIMDASHKHTPYSNADEGCLVFTVVDKPLHFTSGLARLLNPFSHLFF